MRLVGLVGLLVGAQVIAAEGKQKVAMLGLRAEVGVSQSTANLLGEVIAADAARSEKHELMTATDIASLLSLERQKQLTGCADDVSCIAEIGNALGADLLLEVSVGAVGNLRVLSLRLIDTRAGRATRRESESVPGEGDLVPAAHRLVARLFDLPLPTPKRARVVPGFVVLGGAGALTLGGVVLGVMAKNDVSAFAANPMNDALYSSARTKAIAADSLYGTAVVAAAVAAFLLVTGLSSGAEGAGGF